MESNTYFDVYKLGIENISSQIGSLRDVWCVNMFSSYMISVNEEYANYRQRQMLIFGEKHRKGK